MSKSYHFQNQDPSPLPVCSSACIPYPEEISSIAIHGGLQAENQGSFLNPHFLVAPSSSISLAPSLFPVPSHLLPTNMVLFCLLNPEPVLSSHSSLLQPQHSPLLYPPLFPPENLLETDWGLISPLELSGHYLLHTSYHGLHPSHTFPVLFVNPTKRSFCHLIVT